GFRERRALPRRGGWPTLWSLRYPGRYGGTPQRGKCPHTQHADALMKPLTTALIVGVVISVTGCERMTPEHKAAWPDVTVGNTSPAQNIDAACIADYRPDVDYFPEKTS